MLFIFTPQPFEEWWRGINCYPRPSVRYQNLVSTHLHLHRMKGIAFDKEKHPYNALNLRLCHPTLIPVYKWMGE